jgi:hypothetical protein
MIQLYLILLSLWWQLSIPEQRSQLPQLLSVALTFHVSERIPLHPFSLAIDLLPVRIVCAVVLSMWLQSPIVVYIFQQRVFVYWAGHVSVVATCQRIFPETQRNSTASFKLLTDTFADSFCCRHKVSCHFPSFSSFPLLSAYQCGQVFPNPPLERGQS